MARGPKKTTIVSSWNEWDPLKQVIVGRAEGAMLQAPEPAVYRDFAKDGFPYGKWGPMPEEMVAKAVAQLDHFVSVLEKRGIRVDRPTPINFNQTVQTPDWKQESMLGCMPPRDLLLTVGNEILEATMSFRSRWFEYLCYRPLLERYYAEDPEFRWEAAPKPRLTDRTYKKDWQKIWQELSEKERWEKAEASDWIITENEPLFDAADVVRCGRDLFVQYSMVTNDAGIRWLRAHFPHHRVHKVRYRELQPWHMDSTLVPVRPGLVVCNPARAVLTPEVTELLQKNGWEIVWAPKSVLKEKRPLCYCSIWLNMNFLAIDSKTVCVEASETPMMEVLDKHGIEVIPVPFYDVVMFGGCLHCATADVHREGKLEDYFPKQIERF
jgi:glycine amidinotransferase